MTGSRVASNTRASCREGEAPAEPLVVPQASSGSARQEPRPPRRRNWRSWFVALVGSISSAPIHAQSRSPEFGRALAANLGLQARVMWIDATANLDRITHDAGVRDVVRRCAEAGITTLVVDVKPVVGEVVYASQIAERLREWKGKAYPEFDALAAFLREGKAAGLEVYASLNIFSEGHKYFSRGAAYKNPAWQSVSFVVDRGLIAQNGARLPIRGQDEAEDAARTTVFREATLVASSMKPGEKLAVALDDERRVAGMVDLSLLGEEPIEAPEGGHLLVAGGDQLEWVTRNLRPGDKAAFTAQGKLVRATESPSEKVAAFVSPLHPDARARQIALLQEVAKNYAVDGIVFDRMRHANILNDYSPAARASFEAWLGKPVRRWPEEIIEYGARPGQGIRQGPLYEKWLEFRARTIRGFLQEAAEQLRSARPGIKLAAYTGSWFTMYYDVGVNWGSEKFPVRTSWATPSYNEAGYAEFLDWLSTGCYYAVPTRAEARSKGLDDDATVEAAAELSCIAVANSIPVYAGLYVLQYKGDPEAFARSIETALRRSQGVMIFDLSHVYDYGWWDVLTKSLGGGRPSPPHLRPDLTAQLRAAQDSVRSLRDARGAAALPAVPFQPGGG